MYVCVYVAFVSVYMNRGSSIFIFCRIPCQTQYPMFVTVTVYLHAWLCNIHIALYVHICSYKKPINEP
jgi:hypothetical protein